jgi:hypothetical protein
MTKNLNPSTRHKPQTAGRLRECSDDKDAAIHGLLKALTPYVKDKKHPLSRRAQVLYGACLRCESYEDEEVVGALDAIMAELAALDDAEIDAFLAEAEAIEEGILGGLARAAGAVAGHAATRTATNAFGSGGVSAFRSAVRAYRGSQPKQPKVKTANTSSVSNTTKIGVSHPMITKSNSSLRKGTTNRFKESAEFVEAVDDACYGMHPQAARAFRTIFESTDEIESVDDVMTVRREFLRQLNIQNVLGVTKTVVEQSSSLRESQEWEIMNTPPFEEPQPPPPSQPYGSMMKAAVTALGRLYPGGNMKDPNADYILPRENETKRDNNLARRIEDSPYFGKWKD